MRLAVHPNVYYLYLIKLAKWFMLVMPVVALFYTDNGLDSLDIYLLQAIYSLSVAVMEIPSGYMADVIGRRTSLILGAVLGTLGYVMYSISASFGSFLAAEIILGLGGSFISGSDSALLYDSLAESGDNHRYLQFEGRITALGNLAETVAAICGGLLAAYLGYRAVYIGQAAVAALAIPAALLLVEPNREKLSCQPSVRQILTVCRESMVINRKLRGAILLSSVIGTATLCMAWTCQIYFVDRGLDEMAITPIWVVLNLVVAIISALSHRVIRILGIPLAIGSITLLIPMGFILLGTSSLITGLAALLIFYVVRGYATPLLKDLTNLYCDATIRATVLSIRSLIIRTGFAILGPLIGSLSRHGSLATALVTAGIALLGAAIFAAVFLWRQTPELFHKSSPDDIAPEKDQT